jgi:hypothetical protein
MGRKMGEGLPSPILAKEGINRLFPPPHLGVARGELQLDPKILTGASYSFMSVPPQWTPINDSGCQIRFPSFSPSSQNPYSPPQTEKFISFFRQPLPPPSPALPFPNGCFFHYSPPSFPFYLFCVPFSLVTTPFNQPTN